MSRNRGIIVVTVRWQSKESSSPAPFSNRASSTSRGLARREASRSTPPRQRSCCSASRRCSSRESRTPTSSGPPGSTSSAPPHRQSCSARPPSSCPEKSSALLLGLVYTTPKPRTVSAFLEHLAATDPIELRLHLLGYYMKGHHVAEPETIRRAAEGDAEAIDELLAAAAEYADPGQVREPAAGRQARSGREQARAPRPPLGLVRARPARDGAGRPDARRARRRGEARAREVGPARAGRRAAGARHPVGAGPGDRPRRALPRLLAATVGLHERVQAREDLLLPDHPRPRADGTRTIRPSSFGSTRRSATRAG